MANEVNITITGTNLSKSAFRDALGDILKLKAEAAALREELGNLGDIKIDPNEATSSLLGLKSKIQSLGIADLADVNVNPGRLTAQLQLLKRLIGQTGISDILDMNVNTGDLTRKLGEISRLTETIPVNFSIGKIPDLPKLGETGSVSFRVSDSDLASLKAAQQEFSALGVDIGQAQAKMSVMDGSLMQSAIDAMAVRDNFRAMTEGFANASAAASILDGSLLRAALDQRDANRAAADSAISTADLRNSMLDLATSLDGTNAKFARVAEGIVTTLPLFQKAGNGWAFMSSHIRLFGGALDNVLPNFISAVSLWHLSADAIIELGGTLIPAAIAFGIFGAAAIPTVKDVYNILSSTYTVTQAFGQSIYPLTGGFQRMAQAVQPEVYTLLGEGLTFVNSNTDKFQGLAVAAGKVLDDLGARFVNATTQSGTFGKVMSHAAQDLAGWGNLIGNIAGIIGNFLKALPGYAEPILNVLNGVTHALETFTGSGIGQGIINIGLAFHGAFIYIGLLASMATFLVNGALRLIPGVALAAAGALDGLGVAGGVAADGVLAVGGASESLAALPWGWIMVAAAAIGYFAYKMATASDSVRTFNSSIQQGLQQSSLNNLMQNITGGMVSTLNQIVKLENEAAAMPVKAGAPWAELQNQIATYRGGLETLGSQQILVRSRVDDLSKTFGGQAGALAALNGAGVTASQMLDTSSQHWAEAVIEATAYNDTLRAVTQTVGRLGGAQNALNFVAGDSANALGQTVGAMQKVTQAEDSLINVVIGGEQSFVGFQNAISATASTQTNLAGAAKVAGASLGGVNNQSIQLADSFYNVAIPAAQKLIDSLQQQNISTDDLTKAIATQAGEMLTYTGNNDAARAAIVAMINNALGPGTVSLKDLNTWVGNNTTSLAGFKAIVDKAEISSAALANVLETQLNAQFSEDILKSSGATKDMQTFTDTLVNSGQKTTAYQDARKQLITDLENTGMSAQQATNYVNGLQNKINAMHGNSTNVNVNGTGSGGVTVTFNGVNLPPITASLAGAGNHIIPGYAEGGLLGLITGGTGPTADDVLIRASRGEAVIPAWLVPKLAPLLKRYGVPGFASGGITGAEFQPMADISIFGDTKGSGAGLYAFSQAMLKMFMAAAEAAYQKAKAAQAAASAGSGPGGGNAGQNQALAQQMAPQWSGGSEWSNWLALWNQESGWNQFAMNPSSDAYGIPQALPFTKMPQAAWPTSAGGSSNPHAQIGWGIGYISGTYGDPIAAEAHEISQGWYDNGGWLPPGKSIAHNYTGHPERVYGPGETASVKLEIDPGGATEFEQFMIMMIKKWVRVKGAGSVQRAFGKQ